MKYIHATCMNSAGSTFPSKARSAVAIDADRDDDGLGDDAPGIAHLYTGRIQPDIRQVAFQWGGSERVWNSIVDLTAAIPWLLEMPFIPLACNRRSTERVETP